MKEVQDHFFRLAKEQGYRARSAFKLIEIDDRKKLIRKGDRVLDMGAAPGSWTQVAAQRVGPTGSVVAVDLKAIDPRGMPANVSLLQADLMELAPEHFGGKPFDVVISDMGPDTSGDPFGDSIRSVNLCNALLDRFPLWLRKGGHATMKVYEGGEYPALLKRCAALFVESKGFKPKSSRAESVEMFVTCKGYKGPPAGLGDAAPKARPRGWGEPTE
ncbi:MAG: Ribosomal large subunit methyltransferase [Planctomycetota bacterium]